MHVGKWETSNVSKECSGCSVTIMPKSKYMLAKFTLDKEDSNLSRLVTLFLCEQCIQDFSDFVDDSGMTDKAIEVANNYWNDNNPDSPRKA